MKKFISYFAVFILGFVICALAIRGLYGPPGITAIATTDDSNRLAPEVIAEGKNQVAVAAAKIGKSVVNIDTLGRPMAQEGYGGFWGFSVPQEVIPKGQASGVIIRSDGYILTNNHVAANTSKIIVTLWNGKKYPARVVGLDPKTDLAVIKIDAKNLPAATFANSKSIKRLRVGDWVIAVGNALGLGTTVTVGVISATDRGSLNIEGTVLEHAIQTDAAINRGNSGGALADINGNLVGINTAIASTNPGGGSIGIGFAIPSDTADWVADQLMSRGRVIRPWLGIRYEYLDEDSRAGLKARGINPPPVNGALIQEVIQGSPADRAGLGPGDLIIKINGKNITSIQTISDEMKRIKAGDTIELTVRRARTGRNSRIAVTTSEMPSNL